MFRPSATSILNSLLALSLCWQGDQPGLKTERAAPPAATAPAPSSSSSNAKPSQTTACRNSIDRGTKWLLSAMRRDGSLGSDVGRPADLGCTAIAGLALLSQGNTTRAGPHSRELRLLLDAVLDHVDQVPGGQMPGDGTTLLQRKIGMGAHSFLAALFLSQILGEAPDSEADVRRALEKLVWIICRTQGPDGTWGDESWAPVLGTVLGWESLRASHSVGLKIDASARKAGEALIEKLRTQTYDKDNWMHNFYKDAASLRVLYSLGYQDDPAFKDATTRIQTLVREDYRPFTFAGGEEYLSFFLVTECMLKERRDSWQAWYPLVRDKLIAVQNRDGSWSGHHCITARTFCTAAALLTLQAPNLYLPISNL